jgi:hypothetical protein
MRGAASAIGGPEVRRREKKSGGKEVALAGAGGFLGEKNGKIPKRGGCAMVHSRTLGTPY